jgi:hypothetical protein
VRVEEGKSDAVSYLDSNQGDMLLAQETSQRAAAGQHCKLEGGGDRFLNRGEVLQHNNRPTTDYPIVPDCGALLAQEGSSIRTLLTSREAVTCSKWRGGQRTQWVTAVHCCQMQQQLLSL